MFIMKRTPEALTRLRDKRFLAFSTVSFLEPTLSLIEVVPVAVFSECEADHSPPSTSGVKYAWSYTSTPPYVFFIGWFLNNHIDNFTLYKMRRSMVVLLWHVDPLLGNDRDINSYTTAVAR
jgi:hypothetical protein